MRTGCAWASNAPSKRPRVAGPSSRNTARALTINPPAPTTSWPKTVRAGSTWSATSTAACCAPPRCPITWPHSPGLKNYECFALDGHWHQAATHDPRHKGVKMAVGHFYSLDLRRHTLRHLAAGEGLHEHDMSVLKRLKPSGLRHGVPKGTRVLLIYDKAGIDLAYWKRCQRECAVYFISRVKEGMVYDWLDERPVDPHAPRQRGVTADRHIMTRQGQPMRIIAYTDPATGQAYEFLTNEMDLPAGVIAELYRRRWDVEKVFDEIKNKLGEKKAWGTSLVAKATQGQLVALTHNLLLLYEARLERDHGVSNAAEDQRRQERHQALKQATRQAGRPLTTLRTGLRGPRSGR